MVRLLTQTEGSRRFSNDRRFLNTVLKFALTENPTIYTSLIQQFWQTASTSTLEDGEVEITATIDGQLKTITEASLRRHLKLEDADDFKQTKKVYGNAYTKLIMRVKKLERQVKSRQPRRRARVVISDTEEDLEDPFSTAAKNLLYIRKSVEKRIDKGKAIMKEDESIQKKVKKQLKQERLGYEKAIRLQEHINEEERQRIARFRIANTEVRKNMCIYLNNQGGYKQSHFKGMSYEDIRLIFERVWDQNHAFVPKDSEIEKDVMKRPGFDFPQKSNKKNDDSQQQARSSKKRSREDSDKDNAKKQKLEDDAENEKEGLEKIVWM
ncbi:hypothetical protein Tco_0117985 [Tanacetum coccineum]